MLTSKTYVVTWDEMLYNGLDVDQQLSAAGLDYLVYDVSSNPEPRPNWIAAEKVRYYGHFYNSLSDFAATEHDIFIFNAGDAICDNHPAFVYRVQDMMGKDENVWLMAPRMTHDGGDGIVTLVQMSKKYENIGLISHINGIYVAMTRELALVVLDYFAWMLKNGHMDFSKMITGHCLDTVYAAWTIFKNKKIYRDWVFTMETTKVTSYATGTAGKECHTVKDWFATYCTRIGGDENKIRRIYSAIQRNDTAYARQTSSILELYPNLKSEEELDY